MHKVTVISDGQKRIIYAEDGSLLSSVLTRENFDIEHPCSFKGICKKCSVEVNGKKELSCRYRVDGDITVKVSGSRGIMTASAGEESSSVTENMCLCLDLGTTTLVLALVSIDEKKIVKSLTRNNPQRTFAADVMSRIEYASKGGTDELNKVLIKELNSMVGELLSYAGLKMIDKLYAAGNTAMLHLFFGVDPSKMGYAPYTPVFINKKTVTADEVGIEGVGEVFALAGISAFVGADIVAGLGYAGEALGERYNILVDLGTNAEVVLYSKDKLYCTAAAAGPCFEGVNISCGMSAVEGAIYSVSRYGYKTIEEVTPKGICATGLIDAIALMIEYEAIDETGFMEEKEFEIAQSVKITQNDVRQFQLAKGAICSAIEALVKKANIKYDDIDTLFAAGGFSSKMNIGNAVKVGLFPKDIRGKISPINNSCLLGLVKYACEENDFDMFLKNAEYVDLATDEYFQGLFIENMGF